MTTDKEPELRRPGGDDPTTNDVRPPTADDDRGRPSYLGQPAESSSLIIWQSTHRPQHDVTRQSPQIDPCHSNNNSIIVTINIIIRGQIYKESYDKLTISRKILCKLGPWGPIFKTS